MENTLRTEGVANAWVIKVYQVVLAFSRDEESLGSYEESCKVFLEESIRYRMWIHDTTRKPFPEIRFFVSARMPFKIWKISTFLSMSLQDRREFVMSRRSQTKIWLRDRIAVATWKRSKPFFLNYFFFTFSFIYWPFARFRRFACFGRFSGFVPLVSVVSLRLFRLVFSGFSTCQITEHKNFIAHDIISRPFGKLPKLVIPVSCNKQVFFFRFFFH